MGLLAITETNASLAGTRRFMQPGDQCVKRAVAQEIAIGARRDRDPDVAPVVKGAEFLAGLRLQRGPRQQLVRRLPAWLSPDAAQPSADVRELR